MCFLEVIELKEEGGNVEHARWEKVEFVFGAFNDNGVVRNLIHVHKRRIPVGIWRDLGWGLDGLWMGCVSSPIRFQV